MLLTVPAQTPLSQFGKNLKRGIRSGMGLYGLCWTAILHSSFGRSCLRRTRSTVYGPKFLNSVLPFSFSGNVGAEKALWLPMHFSVQPSFWKVLLMRDASVKFSSSFRVVAPFFFSAKVSKVSLGDSFPKKPCPLGRRKRVEHDRLPSSLHNCMQPNLDGLCRLCIRVLRRYLSSLSVSYTYFMWHPRTVRKKRASDWHYCLQPISMMGPPV